LTFGHPTKDILYPAQAEQNPVDPIRLLATVFKKLLPPELLVQVMGYLDPVRRSTEAPLDLDTIRERVEQDYRRVPSPDTWARQADAKAILAHVEALTAQLRQAQEEIERLARINRENATRVLKRDDQLVALDAACRALPTHSACDIADRFQRWVGGADDAYVSWADLLAALDHTR
jgi:hypothetical protein